MSRRLKVVLLSVVLYSRAKLLTAIADRYSAQGKRRWQRRSHASSIRGKCQYIVYNLGCTQGRSSTVRDVESF